MKKSLRTLGVSMAVLAFTAACSQQQAAREYRSSGALPAAAESPLTVSAFAATTATLHEANAVASWGGHGAAGSGRIYGSGGTSGVEVYALDGQRLAQVQTSGELKSLSIVQALAGTGDDLLVGLDVSTPAVVMFAIDGDSGALRHRSVAGLDIDGPYEGLCTYYSRRDGQNYVFLLHAAGRIEQWWLQGGGSEPLRARHVRNLSLSSEAPFCVTDSATGALYVAEKEIGVWRFNADVEAEVVPEIIDIVKFGTIAGEVGGLAVYRNDSGRALLLASNAGNDSLHLYDLEAEHRLIGVIALRGPGESGLVNEAGGLAVTAENLGAGLEQGLLVAMDSDNGDAATNYKLIRWEDLAGVVPLDKAGVAMPLADTAFARVPSALATEPVATPGDAADDPAVWVHPVEPAKSRIIGTNKQGGLYVYDLDGRVVQYLEDGQMNNVDIRYNFSLGGQAVDLVTATNRSNHSIAIYAVDQRTGILRDIADGVQPTAMLDTYGLCMYQQPETRDTWVFANDKSGLYRQWQLLDAGNGRVRAEFVREFAVPGQPEGCVADDEFAILYAGEEDAALWKFSAAPGGSAEGSVVADIASNPALVDDLEGVSLYYGRNGSGYLLLSSQGNDSYAVFERNGDNAYLGSFSVVANAALELDGASETDGLDVISTPLGDRFPYGLFVAQDGRNLMPPENQNYKVVSWATIADVLKLQKHTGWNPRRAVLRH